MNYKVYQLWLLAISIISGFAWYRTLFPTLFSGSFRKFAHVHVLISTQLNIWRVPSASLQLPCCAIISSLILNSMKSHLPGFLSLPKPLPQCREPASFCLGSLSLCCYLGTAQVEIWNNCRSDLICWSSLRITVFFCSLSWESLCHILLGFLFQLFQMGI